MSAEPDMVVVFLVTGSTGEYSDRGEWPVYVFGTEPEARAYVEFLTVKRQELGVGYEDEYDAREAAEKAMQAFDPRYSEDYTGTSWRVDRVAFGPATAPALDPLDAVNGRLA